MNYLVLELHKREPWYSNKIVGFKEGDIGGGGAGGTQYRKKKWQIPKYREENRPNTDTAYFNHICNRFRILMVASMHQMSIFFFCLILW